MTILHIAIYVPGLPFNSNTITQSSLGGSETAGLQMARALRDLGHRIYLFCNCDTQHDDNRIEFIPIERFQHFTTYIQHDVLIVQRSPEVMRNRTQAKLTVLWQHDMTLLRHHQEIVASLWNTDIAMLLSDYHIQQYRDVHGEAVFPDSLVYKTRNGIDLTLFPPLNTGIRDKKTLVYSARPERGLDHLLGKIMPELVKRDPEIKLVICGYDNPAPQLEEFYNHCRSLAASLGDNVRYIGALNKTDLYNLYSRAGLYVYPTPSPANPKFREISCITLMECMAAGLPVVATASGALPETLDKAAGRLIEGMPGTEAHDTAFCDAIMELVGDSSAYEIASVAGHSKAQQLSWQAVAKDWESLFIHRIATKSADRKRTARHFRRVGDNQAALELGEPGVRAVPDYAPPEQAKPDQASIIVTWLRQAGCQSVLDYGQLLPMRKHMPDAVFHSIPMQDKYDAVVLINDIEFENNPASRIAEAMQSVRPGGLVMISTPFGPFDTDRLWNLESADYEEMIGHMDKFDLLANMNAANMGTADPIGYTFARFSAGNHTKQPGQINMGRKLSVQSPRETLSVNIIAGGGKVADTLHWCIKSVLNIADEIIIADTGMDDESLRIAMQYPVKVIKGSNPLEHGFEAPRNEALEASTSDWILWLDTDERLIDGQCITKYLRNNIFDGYGVKQYHFGIGITHDPDMPVRMFRRDRGIRFYGKIHEHPEKELNAGPGMVIVMSDACIMHIGYESERVRSARFQRNAPLLQMDKESYPDRILQKHMIMRDNMIIANNELANNGNCMTKQITELCEETIELWRTYFKGGCKLVGIESTQYYNRACEILGLGVDVAFTLTAGKDGYGDNLNGTGQRFANEDDLMAEIKLKTDRATGQYLKDYF